MENKIIHRADSRGNADLGWLKSKHTFSFANYYNPDRMNFGALRVLNDDTVSGGRGFGDHPHDNMEIISIPLEGDLVHKDSMGNEAVIKAGEIQVMSAGTGIYHSEYNKNQGESVKFLQIWLYPNQRNVKPRYDQIKINTTERNKFHQILSPNADDAGVWIYQNAWFHIGTFDGGSSTSYQLKDKNNGVYAFVLTGEVNINGENLGERDGMGIWNVESLDVKATKDARVLLMEVPMLG
ncbi:pirin family protein [Mucilaginibacter sp. RS28]|uniref:Pirin family protein n=1 Tax=Mucilaginibacter straminoryzae TaxID=2932774 RepID=A0A9X1X4T5_9SPHI|nr:pirin family protein [Mucilaginibacter straminoryzae]MCJ8211001.1 pirin family protein [Mucilaginibacter straminoryzae]